MEFINWRDNDSSHSEIKLQISLHTSKMMLCLLFNFSKKLHFQKRSSDLIMDGRRFLATI
jgi:hypothetical protein